MMEVIHNIGWAIVFSVVGGLVGMMLVLLASVIVPRLIDRFTPKIDEQKESCAETGPWRVLRQVGRRRHPRGEHCGGCGGTSGVLAALH